MAIGWCIKCHRWKDLPIWNIFIHSDFHRIFFPSGQQATPTSKLIYTANRLIAKDERRTHLLALAYVTINECACDRTSQCRDAENSEKWWKSFYKKLCLRSNFIKTKNMKITRTFIKTKLMCICKWANKHYINISKTLIYNAVKWLITINHIQNKSFCLYKYMCVYFCV